MARGRPRWLRARTGGRPWLCWEGLPYPSPGREEGVASRSRPVFPHFLFALLPSFPGFASLVFSLSVAEGFLLGCIPHVPCYPPLPSPFHQPACSLSHQGPLAPPECWTQAWQSSEQALRHTRPMQEQWKWKRRRRGEPPEQRRRRAWRGWGGRPSPTTWAIWRPFLQRPSRRRTSRHPTRTWTGATGREGGVGASGQRRQDRRGAKKWTRWWWWRRRGTGHESRGTEGPRRRQGLTTTTGGKGRWERTGRATKVSIFPFSAGPKPGDRSTRGRPAAP